MELREAFGRNFNIDRKAGKRYEDLRHGLLFYGMENKNIFLLAMVLGFKRRLERKKFDRYPLLNTSSFTDADLWLVAALAFAEAGDLMILDNPNEMRRIAEDYAMAGLPEVERLVAECDSVDSLVLELNKNGVDSLASLKK